MKKGVVVERHRKYTIVLTRDGEFQKAEILDEDDVSIGTEVTYKPLPENRKSFLLSFRRVKPSVLATAAACSLFLFLFPLYLFSENQTYAYVTIDINPSIELEIDEEFRVKDLHALNDDAEHIMNNLEDIQNEPVEAVIHKITKVSENTGKIQNGHHMIVGISYAEESKANADLMGNLEAYFTTNMEGWNVATLLIPEDVREMALKKEASMNEVMAAQLMDDNEDSESMDSLNEEDKEIINIFYRPEQKEKSDNPDEVGVWHRSGLIKETLGRQAGISLETMVNRKEKQLPVNSDQGTPEPQETVNASPQAKPEQKSEKKQESQRTEVPAQQNDADKTTGAEEKPGTDAAEKDKQKSGQKAAKQSNGNANGNGKHESGKGKANGKGKGKEEPDHGPGNGKKHDKDNKDHKENQNGHDNKHNKRNDNGSQKNNSQGPPHKDQKNNSQGPPHKDHKNNNDDPKKHKDHQHGKK